VDRSIVHAFSLIFSRQCKHELPSAIGRLSSVKLILAIGRARFTAIVRRAFS
jgi:hypothetical protein